MCDASAVVALDDRHFAVGDDEDNLIRLYRLDGPGKPYFTLELSRFLQVTRKAPEVDIEGAARVGNRVYWITSHGCNAKGEEAPNRHRLFATDIFQRPGHPPFLLPAGHPRTDLLEQMGADPRLESFRLYQAAGLAPKAKGALNIEGLAASPEGHLLIGFRNPLIAGKALIVRLLNPAETLAGHPGRFGPPQLLDLGGLGLRSLERWHEKYLLVGGAYGEGGRSHLFTWSGDDAAPKKLALPEFETLNPESIGIIFLAGQEKLLVVSDDGTLQVGGKPCKKLKDPNLRRFRAWLGELPSADKTAPALEEDGPVPGYGGLQEVRDAER